MSERDELLARLDSWDGCFTVHPQATRAANDAVEAAAALRADATRIAELERENDMLSGSANAANGVVRDQQRELAEARAETINRHVELQAAKDGIWVHCHAGYQHFSYNLDNDWMARKFCNAYRAALAQESAAGRGSGDSQPTLGGNCDPAASAADPIPGLERAAQFLADDGWLQPPRQLRSEIARLRAEGAK